MVLLAVFCLHVDEVYVTQPRMLVPFFTIYGMTSRTSVVGKIKILKRLTTSLSVVCVLSFFHIFQCHLGN